MIDIKSDVRLAPLTIFRIGGEAKLFVEVASIEELREALVFANKNNEPFFILGGGSNIIINDKGFNGLVIKIKERSEECEAIFEEGNCLLDCWSGDNLSKIVNFAAKNSLTGLEDLIGIPGTAGGAVRGNAGAYDLNEVGIAKFIDSVSYIDSKSETLEIKTLSKEECDFRYRQSVFKDNSNFIIVGFVLNLKIGNEGEIGDKTRLIIKKRVEQKPKNWFGSTGSFFKNPEVSRQLQVDYEKDTGKRTIEGGIVSANWLISRVGLSGKKIGGVQVSEKNCNFLVNVGNATAEDVVMLVSLVKQKVRSEFGVQLEQEVNFLGF